MSDMKPVAWRWRYKLSAEAWGDWRLSDRRPQLDPGDLHGVGYEIEPIYPASTIEQMVESLAMHLAGCDRETWREYGEEVRESYRAEARRILGLEKDDE